jgi:ribose/xylose/arabinose/galactoside ABC-type transport system permease subunit
MSFEDTTQTGPVGRSLGVSSGEFRAVQRDALAPATPGGADPRTAPQPNLHYVFDDPNDGEVGRDKVVVHVVWELALLAGIVVAGIALVGAQPGALSQRALYLEGSLGLLLALASALSLRAGVPNLAVGGVAVLAGAFVATHSHGSWGGAAGEALAICAGLGFILGVAIVGLHVPAWAASLAALLALGTWASVQRIPSIATGYDPNPDAYLWFGGVAGLSIVLSLVGLHPGLRRGFARFRPVADPAKRRGIAAGVIAVVVTVVSSVLAGLAGVLLVLIDELPRSGIGDLALRLTAFGVGAALLGATSAFGRRGGILGTALAAALLTVVLAWADRAHPSLPAAYILAVAIAVGLVTTRLVERFGRPVLRPSGDEDESWGRTQAQTPPTTPWQGGLWSSDESWGTPRR